MAQERARSAEYRAELAGRTARVRPDLSCSTGQQALPPRRATGEASLSVVAVVVRPAAAGADSEGLEVREDQGGAVPFTVKPLARRQAGGAVPQLAGRD